MSSASNAARKELTVSPLNFIYACSICCATINDIYEYDNETVQGLSDGINPTERLVTKLYLANCCHVFCTKHLDDGGPPFHPAGERPRASCPVCIQEKSDSDVRDLFSIRGFVKGEYDPQIPPTWFSAPPIRLDGNGKEMDALRFQYLALIRFCQNVYATYQPKDKAIQETQKQLTSLQDLASEEHARFLSTQEENMQLRAQQEELESAKVEIQRLQSNNLELERYRKLHADPRDFETFIENKQAIRHYLSLVPKLIEQNDKMRQRLAFLGFAMPLEPISNLNEINSDLLKEDNTCHSLGAARKGSVLRKVASSLTAGRSRKASECRTDTPMNNFDHRLTKRRRVESVSSNGVQYDCHHSRNAMPPPPKPNSRMKSIRKLFPSWSKQLSSPQPVSYARNDSLPRDSLRAQMAEERRDTPRNGPVVNSTTQDQSPYMSGALSEGQGCQRVRAEIMDLNSSAESSNCKPEFTFRAPSPHRLNGHLLNRQRLSMPIEPSYLRLMDPLSNDLEVEFSLRDPREAASAAAYHGLHRHGSSSSIYRENDTSQSNRSPDRWNFGHPFLSQPLSRPSSAQTHHRPQGYSRSTSLVEKEYEPIFDTVTPAPQRHQQTNSHIQNVVSPLFVHDQSKSPSHHKEQFAEKKDSSHHSNNYQFRRTKVDDKQRSWHEPRSLNGLSFFDSPVNSRNEPIKMDRMWASPRCYHPAQGDVNNDFGSKSFREHVCGNFSPSFNDSSYGSLLAKSPSSVWQPHASSRTFTTSPRFPRSSRPYMDRTLIRPSAAFRSSRSPIQHWDTLRRIGFKSSQRTFVNNAPAPAAALRRSRPFIPSRRIVKK